MMENYTIIVLNYLKMEFGEGKIGGKYITGPKIGGGSFGEVYLANLFGTQEVFALKRVFMI